MSASKTDAEPAYLEPLREQMATVEKTITEREAELAELRGQRTNLGRALAALDPHWAANHKRKNSQPKAWKPPAGRLDEVLAWLGETYPDGQLFTASEVSEGLGQHHTSIHKVLHQLHKDGRIVLDHKGGSRNMTNYFRLPPASD